MLHDSTAVYQDTTEADIRERLRPFREKWDEREPQAVATLERDFDRTIDYLVVRDQAFCRRQD